MDRRSFLQTTGLTAVAAMAGRTAVASTPKKTKDVHVKKLPARSEVKQADTWDLSKLYPNDAAWEKAFDAWQKQFDGLAKFKGHLADGPEMLAECLTYDLDLSRTADRLGHYAHLKVTEDQTNDVYQRMMGRFMQAAVHVSQLSSYIRPEILAIPTEKMDRYLGAKALAPYKLLLERVIRFRPHTLGAKEERLIAMQGEMADAADKIFTQLTNADMKFGNITKQNGETLQLTNGNFIALLESPDRDVRKKVFDQYYAEYKAHDHTLAASLSSSMQRDIYYAKAREYPSALDAAMFPDNVPVAVYDNLISTVHEHLPALYHYYEVRQRKMNLPEIHWYDIYTPILSQLRIHHNWEEAVKVIVASLKPLGSEYCGVIEKGLTCDRWCDRYENRGKKSGAFSAGSFDGNPYILMNFQPSSLDSVFTLTHEGGHSMHSYYSAETQPFAYYNYVIFVAEVASTTNEILLAHYLLEHAKSDKERAYYLNRQLDGMKNTIYRQTMFAEFEKLAHESAEANEPLTLDRFRSIYHALLVKYFGPHFVLDPDLDLECLRIPHFYRAFYVYKYATSMSASMALANRLLTGGQQELTDYLTFLKGGCSKDPLDLLRGAGVNMATPQPIDSALTQFGKMVNELDSLI